MICYTTVTTQTSVQRNIFNDFDYNIVSGNKRQKATHISINKAMVK